MAATYDYDGNEYAGVDFLIYGPGGAVSKPWREDLLAINLFGVLANNPFIIFDEAVWDSELLFATSGGVVMAERTPPYAEWGFRPLDVRDPYDLRGLVSGIAVDGDDVLAVVEDGANARLITADLGSADPMWQHVADLGDTAQAIVPITCREGICGVSVPGTGRFHPIQRDGARTAGWTMGPGVDVGGLPFGMDGVATEDGATFHVSSSVDDQLTRIDVAPDGSTTVTTHVLEPGCTGVVAVLSAAADSALAGCAESLVRAVAF